ncbi:hypothetical protein KR49_00145 [Synechococcus sp. KORDI-49]|nr:hypothetical protein KR49_00145 [Synechococcus sp. KORDI-49]
MRQQISSLLNLSFSRIFKSVNSYCHWQLLILTLMISLFIHSPLGLVQEIMICLPLKEVIC